MLPGAHFPTTTHLNQLGRPPLLPRAAAARRLLGVVEAYRCHLQDSAQYTLGLLLTAMLEDPGVAESDVRAIAQDLVRLLLRPRSTGQCQGEQGEGPWGAWGGVAG